MSNRKKYTEYQKRAIYANGNGRCGICGKPINFEDMTVDHKIPLSCGGTDDIENLQPAHLCCNRIKNGLNMTELIEKISVILRYQCLERFKRLIMTTFVCLK